jgi:type IV pilus assembly protein PilM
MPGKDKGLVGIELNKDELRAVYVQYRGNKPQVTAAGWTRMPEGGLDNGTVDQPAVVGIALRKLMSDIGVPANVPAVIGIPAEGVTVRTLNVPPAPDEELATIVAGEVEHYRILRTKGSHAYVPLTPPVRGNANTPISVVIAAAEEQVTRSMGDLASRADVQIAALEPLAFGHLRAVAASLAADEHAALAILVGESTTDLAVFSKGQMWFYRRLEYGIRTLIPGTQDYVAHSAFGDNLDEPVGVTQKYNDTMLETLASEIGRSIDYLAREYKEHGTFTTLLISVDDPIAADIVAHLGERLSIPMSMIAPFSGVSVRPDVAMGAQAPDGFRFACAFGLAIRDSLMFSAGLPRVDLYAAERTVVRTQTVRRNLAGSLAASAAAILVGVGGYYLYNRQISTIDSQADTSKNRANALMSQADAMTSQHRRRENQLRLLSEEGVAATAILDFLADSLDPGVGIQSLSIAPDKTLTLIADAVDESSMLHTVERIQKIPILQGVMVQTFTARTQNQRGLNFTLVAKTLPLSSIKVVAPGTAQSGGGL